MFKTWKWVGLMAVWSLSACTWEMYENEDGKTRLRQKYPLGTGVYYQNGAASQNTHYHDARPEQKVILPNSP